MTTDARALAAATRQRKDAAALAVLAVLLGLYGWVVFALAFDHDGLIGPYFNAPGSDYMVYWQAVHSALAGDFALLADPVALTERLNQEFRDWLSQPLPLHPWLYPPHFLLILLPFAGLPFALSYAAFQLASFAAAVAGGWCWAGPARRRILWLAGLALAPAASINVIAGQNGFLTLALLLGGVGLLGRADVAAGAILGLLSYKPQFALLVPVVLLALGNWRALAAAAGSAAIAAAASALVFGVASWQGWVAAALGQGGPHDAGWLEAGRLWGLSIWTCATLLGAPGWLANACQGVAVLAGAASVWSAFRRPIAPERRMAVLLLATLLAAPHVSSYDLVLLAAVVLLLFRALLDGAPMPLRPSLLLLPWAVPFAPLPRGSLAGFGLPVLIVGLLAVLLAPTRRYARAPEAATLADRSNP